MQKFGDISLPLLRVPWWWRDTWWNRAISTWIRSEHKIWQYRFQYMKRFTAFPETTYYSACNYIWMMSDARHYPHTFVQSVQCTCAWIFHFCLFADIFQVAYQAHWGSKQRESLTNTVTILRDTYVYTYILRSRVHTLKFNTSSSDSSLANLISLFRINSIFRSFAWPNLTATPHCKPRCMFSADL